jgi:hypothetical protein
MSPEPPLQTKPQLWLDSVLKTRSGLSAVSIYACNHVLVPGICVVPTQGWVLVELELTVLHPHLLFFKIFFYSVEGLTLGKCCTTEPYQ